MSIKIRKDVMKQMRVKIYNKVAKILLGIFKIGSNINMYQLNASQFIKSWQNRGIISRVC